MQRAAQAILASRPAGSQSAISGSDAVALRKGLSQDAADYYSNALVSFCAAVDGLCKGQSSWPTVQLYYSVFYALSAMLNADGYCVFYIGRKAHRVEARVGERPQKASGTTHESVLKYFKEKYSHNTILSQPIGGEEPLTWMENERVRANYQDSRFSEPGYRDAARLHCAGLRALIGKYLVDINYSFQPDHALVAYPLLVLREASGALRAKAIKADPELLMFAMRLSRDKAGQMALLRAPLIDGIAD